MDGQMSIYDYEELLPDHADKPKPNNGYEIFSEHCRHRGWHKQATETTSATWMCGYAGKRLAQGWSDWIPCTECNCPLLK